MTIGERICALRKENHLSQGQLANILDISRQAISKWENDLTAPDTLKLIQLADVLNTDVEYLATGNHATLKAQPQVVTVVRKVDNVVEKIVEKPVVVERIIEIEKPVEVVVEKPVIKKVVRTKYVRNPFEFLLAGLAGLLIGIILGVLI